jgi:queuine/archaeosine tRNA-ribosyltransferase
MVAGAVGSLGPDDLSEIGVRAVAVDVLELAMGAGLQRIADLGGIGAYLGWDGTILAVARWSTAPPASPGWRGLERKRESRLLLRSAVDGALTEVDLEELARVVAGLGAQPSAELVPGGSPVVWWNAADGGAPPGDCVVTAMAQEEAARGRFRAGHAWHDLTAFSDTRDDTPRALVEGCACRACSRASLALLRHLWLSREISAAHLLCWHNLHSLLLEVEPGYGPRG